MPEGNRSYIHSENKRLIKTESFIWDHKEKRDRFSESLTSENSQKSQKSIERKKKHRKKKKSWDSSSSLINTFKNNDLESLLAKHKLNFKYYKLFIEQEINDIKTFKDLSGDDLIEIGIENIRDRNKIIAIIKNIN